MDLRAQFIAAMLTSGHRDIDEIFEDASKLADMCGKVPAPNLPPADPVTANDRAILDALVFLVREGGMHHGARASHWKLLTESRGLGARRAWEAASARLLRAGLVRQQGARWLPADVHDRAVVIG